MVYDNHALLKRPLLRSPVRSKTHTHAISLACGNVLVQYEFYNGVVHCVRHGSEYETIFLCRYLSRIQIVAFFSPFLNEDVHLMCSHLSDVFSSSLHDIGSKCLACIVLA